LPPTLLKVAPPGAVALGRRAGYTRLGFLGLRGLWTPAHRPPLASYESAGDRLGEGVHMGKGEVIASTTGRGDSGESSSHSFISASAFSSQYVIPISRYIVVAMVRCS